MRITDLSPRRPSKSSVRFLTAHGPLPKSPAGDAVFGSSGGGMTDCMREAAVAIAANQVHDGARAPPACLIVQLSKPGCDPKSTSDNSFACPEASGAFIRALPDQLKASSTST